MSIILIQNTSAQLHGIGKQSNNQAGALVQDPLINLKPGLNKVSEEDWTTAKKNKMVQKHIDEGTFVELKEVESLSRLSPPEAQKMIDQCVDFQLLTEWMKEDKRVQVRKALTTQLEKLEKPEPGTVKPTMGKVRTAAES